MTEEHLSALLTAAEAKKNDQGFLQPAEGRTITLYIASGGASVQVSKIEALKTERDLLHARTSKGELFVIALVDVFAGSVEGPSAGGRKAGFA